MIYRYESKLNFLILNIVFAITSLDNLVVAFVISGMTNFATKKSFDGFFNFVLVAIFSVVIIGAFSILANSMEGNITKRINQKLRTQIFSNALNDKSKKQDYLSFLINDFKLLETNGLESEYSILKSVYAVIISAFSSFFLSWELTLVYVIGSLIPLVISNISQSPISRASDGWSIENKNFTNKTKEFLDGRETLNIYNGKNVAIQIENGFIGKLESSLKKMNLIINNSSSFIELASILFNLILPFVFGTFLVINGSLTLPILFAVVQLANSITGPVVSILGYRNKISSTRNIKTHIKIKSNFKRPDEVKQAFKSMTLSNISLLRGGKPLIRNLNLSIQRGQKVAITGRSGIGKTSFFNFLLTQII
ncbi:ABC transporter transmembrane domain-containing protein [Pediococcus siamensis]|uniref:ABC transporter transmembrane domain-containing protein n=1 Tax=Pediococcus siamensis TaxID=381829 RepID=UPI0039A27D0B